MLRGRRAIARRLSAGLSNAYAKSPDIQHQAQNDATEFRVWDVGFGFQGTSFSALEILKLNRKV